MGVAIVYDSATGTTKASAEQMGEVARAAGHGCSVDSIHEIDPAEVTAADVICIGAEDGESARSAWGGRHRPVPVEGGEASLGRA